MPITIDALPTVPSTASPTTFAADMDAFLAALPTFRSQLNTFGADVAALEAAADATAANVAAAQDSEDAAAASAASAANAPGTSATSTTSVTIGTGAKTLTIQTGKAFAVGQKVNIARTSDAATSSMYGTVTVHDSGTGSLTVSVETTTGSGTYTDWTVSLSGARGLSMTAWQGKSADYTAISGERIAVDTSGAPVTVTLPLAPTANDFVEFMDDGGAFDTNALTVARNGQTIMGLAEDMSVSTNYASFGLRFNGTTWRIY